MKTVRKTRRRGGGFFTNKFKQAFTRKRRSSLPQCVVPQSAAENTVQCLKQVYRTTVKYEDVVSKVCACANVIAKTYHVVDINLCTYHRKLRSTDRTVAMISYTNKPDGVVSKQIHSHSELITTEANWPTILVKYLNQQLNNQIKIVGLNCDAYSSTFTKNKSSFTTGAIEFATGVDVDMTNNSFLTDSRFVSVFFTNEGNANEGNAKEGNAKMDQP